MGAQRTERECIYIHLHRRLLKRSEFRAVWNQDADSIQTSVEIDAHAVLIKPLVLQRRVHHKERRKALNLSTLERIDHFE